MTDFERKPSDKKNLNANGSDPIMELTRLMRGKDSSPNWQDNAQGYDAPIDERQQSSGYQDDGLSGDENSFNYNPADPQGYSSFNDDSYLPEYENNAENYPVYQTGGEQSYSDQTDGYWAEENIHSEQQNQYSENDNYYYEGAAQVSSGVNRSTESNAPYAIENEGQDFAYENSNQQGANAPGFDWNSYNEQSQNNQQGRGYSDFVQNGLRQEPSFYEEDNYSSQDYSASENSQLAGASPLDYNEATNYDYRDDAISHIDQGSIREDLGVNGSAEFGSSETQYWTRGIDENPAYDNEQGTAAQWSPSFDENEQFANEFGIEPNQGIFRGDAPVFPIEGADLRHVSSGDERVGEVQFNNQDTSYEGEPEFVEELSHNQGTATAPAIPSSTATPRQNIPLPFGGDNSDEFVDQSRPLGAVIAPMRMATQSRSFLGYGQAVSVVPSRGQQKSASAKSSGSAGKSGFTLSRANPVVPSKPVEKQNIANNSSPIGRGINPFLAGKAEQKVPEKIPSVASENNEFEDALNDFNLTIKGDPKKRYKRDTGIKTVRPDQHAVPETQSFDLPPVYYGDRDNTIPPRNPLDQEFSDVLAPGVRDAAIAVQDELGINGVQNGLGSLDGLAQTSQAQAIQSGAQPVFAEAAVDASKYDWAAPHSDSQIENNKSGGSKKVLFLLGILAVILACIGAYYAFLSDKDSSQEPVVINRDEGEVKVAPPVDANANQNNQDQAVYNRVESGNAPKTEQSELIDHSEAPVDLDKVDEQAPSANETSLEPNSVEARVLQATENSLAVHEVPTVTIRDSNNVSGDDINSIIANQQENVLTPGQAFKDHLKTETDGQQALPSDSLQPETLASDSVAQNNVAVPASQGEATGQSNSSSLNQPTANTQQNAEHGANQPENSGLASLSANNNANSTNQLGTSPVTGNNEAEIPSSSQAANLTAQAPTAANSAVQNDTGSNLAAGTFYVQIASQPSRDAAQQSLADIKKQPQINSLIANRQVVIVAAEIPGRGTYYRVRIAANNQTNANQLCNQLKDLQVSCFVGK